MTTQEIVEIIKDLGFPIAVAVVLLYFVLNKVDKQLDELGKRIEKLTDTIKDLVTEIKKR